MIWLVKYIVAGVFTLFALSRPDFHLNNSRLLDRGWRGALIIPDANKEHLVIETGLLGPGQYRITDINLNDIAQFGAVRSDESFRHGYHDGATYWGTSEIITGNDIFETASLSFDGVGNLEWGAGHGNGSPLSLPSSSRIDSATVKLPSLPWHDQMFIRIELSESTVIGQSSVLPSR